MAFKCPNCKQEISYVTTYSECSQTAEIKENGDLYNFGETDSIGSVTSCECPDCGEVITGWQE